MTSGKINRYRSGMSGMKKSKNVLKFCVLESPATCQAHKHFSTANITEAKNLH